MGVAWYFSHPWKARILKHHSASCQMFSHQYRYPKRNKTQTAEINMAVNRMLENKIHYLDAKASNVDLVRLKILWKVRRASPSFYIRRSPRHPLPDFHEINLFKTTRDSLSEDLSFVKRGFAEENRNGKASFASCTHESGSSNDSKRLAVCQRSAVTSKWLSFWVCSKQIRKWFPSL